MTRIEIIIWSQASRKRLGWVILIVNILIVSQVLFCCTELADSSRTASVATADKGPLRGSGGMISRATTTEARESIVDMGRPAAISSPTTGGELDKRDEAKKCLMKLHGKMKPRYIENGNLTIPFLNSVQQMSDELSVFWSLGRHTDMRDEEHSQYRNGTYYCDDSTEARVVPFTQKFNNQVRMYCPLGTKKVWFDSPDPVLKQKLTFALEPFLRCDKLKHAVLPPIPQISAENKQTIAACTQVRFEQNYEQIPQWIEYHRMIGVDTFWIYINDSMERFQKLAPEVSKYFERFDVQEYASAIPFMWTTRLENFFFRK